MDELMRLHSHGVFLRREALEVGYDDRALYAAIASGVLSRVRHGAYVSSETWRASDENQQHLLRAHAAGLVHSQPAELSHISAAIAHGMRVWGVDLSRIHLTRPEHTVGRKHRDIAYHRGAVGGGDQISGTPVRPAAEAAFGAACHASVEAGTVILDSAYHLGICSQDQLREQYETHRGWPGTARLNVTLRFAQPGSQSVAESRMRFLFYQYGLPKPQLQYVVRDGSDLIGNTDFGWPEYGVLGEFDGRVKYEKYLRPGETPADAVIREKLREDRMREATGYSFIRFTWADFYKPDQTAERTRRALSRGNRLVLPGDINSAR